MVSIGEVIRVNRNGFGYSQEELCFGICTPGSLSKIENGDQVPSRATFTALMERMGLSAGVYPSFLSEKDRKAFELQYDFFELFEKGEYAESSKVLDEFKKLPKLEKAYENFVSTSRLLLQLQSNEITASGAAEAFEEIIKAFIKDFSVGKIRRSLLTRAELNTLNSYAIAKHRSGDVETAKNVLYECITYIDSKVYDKSGIAIAYTKLLYNLSKYVGMSGDDAEAARLCDLGIRACRRYDRHTYLHLLLYNKGYALMSLGKLEESHQLIRESYYVQRALGGTDDTGSILDFAEKHGIKL